ncbi:MULTISPECIES: DUF6762 family protein [Clostridium]|uniref:Uncharacterized protein n=1 Tax=Clostridium paridis TaxID=2803863 RepID=A0A937FFW3_9CLOT|nr:MULTISPECIES: DUF6762 family protein [Clostridium]MBL4932438.1 hypothetical protein [Clostridium paridis]
MDFSALVLMERDGATGHLIREVGSYSVNEGAIYVTKLYLQDGVVNLFFGTGKDVEDWEFSAIYDLFDVDAFEKLGYNIEEIDSEFNPLWKITFDYEDDHEEIRAILNELCTIINECISKVLEDIKDKESEYI